jgi:hypothetical protein
MLAKTDMSLRLGDTNSMENRNKEHYLYVVEYNDDSERKRVEYLFNNWEVGDVERPDGLVRIATDVDNQELYKQLVTKIPEEQIQSFRLESATPDVDPESTTVEWTIETTREPVESFLDYVFSKRKATLQSPEHNHYKVYTKKGRADVRYTLTENEEETTVQIRIEGYPPAPGFLAEFFENELKEFSQSQQ